MAATRSRATRSAERAEHDALAAAEQNAAEQNAAGQAAAREAPAAQPAPTAAFDLGAGRIVYFRPSLTLPDGDVIDCPHAAWGHNSEKTALGCVRKLAAEHGVELAKP